MAACLHLAREGVALLSRASAAPGESWAPGVASSPHRLRRGLRLGQSSPLPPGPVISKTLKSQSGKHVPLPLCSPQTALGVRCGGCSNPK